MSDEDKLIKVYLTLPIIGYSNIPKSEIKKALQQYSVIYILKVISIINSYLYSADSINPRYQYELIKLLWGESIAQSLYSKVPYKYSDSIIFHPLQIMYLLKLGLVCCPTYADHEAESGDLIKILIAINSHLEQQYYIRKKIAVDFNQEKEAMIELGIRNISFNSTEFLHNLIARYYAIFIDLSDDVPENVKIKQTFNDITGTDLKTYWAIGYATLTRYLDKKLLKETPVIDLDFFNSASVPREKILKVLKYWSMTLEEAKYVSKTTLDNPYDVTYFRAKPLIEISNELFIVTNPKFLAERFTKGVFWSLFDNFGKEKTMFSSHFGKLLEQCYKNFCEQIFTSLQAQQIGYNYHPEKEYISKKSVSKSTDIVVSLNDCLGMFEITSSRLKMNDTIITGRIKSFREDLRKIVLKKARQLNNNINALKDGQLKYENLDFNNINKIYPVIVLNDVFPLFPFTWEIIQNELASYDHLVQQETKSLFILDMEEYEILISLADEGKNVFDILDAWYADEDYKYLNFKSFVSFYFGAIEISKHISKVAEQSHSEMLKILFPKDS